MRRKILTSLLAIVGAIVVAIATLPFWFGALAKALAPRFGVTFTEYSRLGYGRFALRDVEFRREGVQATAETIESPSPLAWLWQRARGEGASLKVGAWSVALAPAATKSEPPDDAAGPSGWMPLRAHLTNTIATVEPWLAQASVGRGTLKLPDAEVTLAGATWRDRTLRVEQLAFKDRVFDAELALPAGSDEIRVSAKTATDEARVEITSRGPVVAGELAWWGQPAGFSAEFPAEGWIPARAEISAINWNLPAERLRLGEYYASVQADTQLFWSGQHFTVDVSANSTPLDTRRDAAPPLDLELRGRGDLQALTIEQFRAQMPGAHARLTAPVTVTRSGAIQGEPGRFETRIQLSELPWIEATGEVSGQIEVAATVAGTSAPPVTFQFNAGDVSAQGVAVRSATVAGRLEWPRMRVTEANIVGTHGEQLRARGGWDFGRKAAEEVNVTGELRRETFARWLPAAVKFETVRLEASADGSLEDLEHRGTVDAADVTAATMKPASVRVQWNGKGLRADRIDAKLVAGESSVALTAAADRESVQLSALEITPRGEAPLRLVRPASVRWTPALEVDGLALQNEKSTIAAEIVWADAGRVAVALRNVPSTWLTDFVTLPGAAWRIGSLAVNGTWDRGPLTFEAVAEVAAVLRDERAIAASMHWQGGADGVRLVALRALENDATVISASGRAPLVITPRGAPAWRIDPDGAIALEASTVANTAFWDDIGELIGVTLRAPQLSANIGGTWRAPTGQLEARVEQIALRRQTDKPLPPIEQLELLLRADRRGVDVEQLAVRIAGQPVRASGRVPLPEDDWAALRKDPLGYLRRGADVRLEIPRTDIAAFKELLPPLLVPQGTIEANVRFEKGALDGSLQLRDAATRPLGSVPALRDIGADIRLEGETVRIASASAQLSGEPIRIAGTVTLPPLDRIRGGTAAALPKFNLTAQANNIPLVRQTGTLVRADLDVKVESPDDAPPLISGTVRLRDSLFLQDVRALIPKGTASKSERPPYFAVEAEPFSAWRLAVTVEGNEFMRLRTTLFHGVASAEFQLGGTLGEPTLLGEATIDRGNIRLPFANFEVQEAYVALTPAQPHSPQIFLTATTRRYEYDLRMEVTGDASAPVVTFESTPPLEHGQILLMVTAGVVPENAVAVSHRQRATRLGSYLGSTLLSGLGGGEDTNRLTITSGEDISEQGRETYDIEYKLDRRWSLTAEYDEYDTHSVGVKWEALARGGSRLAGGNTESSLGTGEGPAGAEGAANRDADTGEPSSPDGTETARRGGDAESKPAKLDVSGLGWFRNLETKASLKRMLGPAYGPEIGSHAIEDAVFLLLSSVRADGFLKPRVRVAVVNTDGTRREFTVDADLTTPVPRGLAARSVQFDVERGTHYFVQGLDFSGLSTIEPKAARAYFVADRGLFKRQSARTFTPDRLKRGVAGLQAALRELGYAEAEVTAAEPRIDDRTGAVTVDVSVVEGPRWQTAAVKVEGALEQLGGAETVARFVGQPWSESLEQDIAVEIRRQYLQAGYADARIQMTHSTRPGADGGKAVDVTARVLPGEKITIGAVRFEGNPTTVSSVLQRRVPFGPGDPLNPVAMQEARHRIARLGVYEKVNVEVEPQDGPVRDVVFDLRPGRRMALNLLAGYNTYEQLRAGVEVLRYNVWGRAHRTRGLLVQSMKSTRGEYSYTVPELFGEDVHGTARVFGLQREEVAFVRQEYGARFTVDTPLRFLGANLTAGYTFEVLRNRDNELETRSLDRRQVEVASVEAGLVRDRRDNPLLPRDGYRWYGRLEAASEIFGGRAEYQRLEMGGTYHRPVGDGQWLHTALAHGIITTLGRDDLQLPVNKRFFPGGDGSNRGYALGEAAPRTPDGRFEGAKSYLGGSIEFEQALLDKWSAVVFVDALGSAARIAEYPFDEVLVAAGLGLRYQTLIGPVRAEYGHNLNRREGDPRGTFHLSIGFAF